MWFWVIKVGMLYIIIVDVGDQGPAVLGSGQALSLETLICIMEVYVFVPNAQKRF